ncbi:MAG: tetratricopeptide repeat protein [Bacteroidales bacterium]
MKKQILIIGLLLFSTLIYSQNKVDSLVNIGIEYHDKGKYDKAIETYKSALKINPNSALANYEIAMTYMYAKDYKNAIKHSDKVIKLNDKYLLPAYITKASCLDNLGKIKESIELFKEGIEKFGDNHLLYYNLALNYYKTKEYDNAEQAVINAINTKSSHASSHLLLGQLMYDKNLKAQSLVCLHYFLFLEPNTERSRTAYNLLQKQFNGNVKADKDKPNTFNININSIETETEFSHADLMISMLEATKTIEENENKSEDEMFIENTKSFFNILGELKKEDSKGLWWDFYIPFFDEIANSEHIDTYCYYISKSSNPRASDWLKANDKKFKDFAAWLKDN